MQNNPENILRRNKAMLFLLLAFGVFMAGSYALLYSLKPSSSHSLLTEKLLADKPVGGDFTLNSAQGPVSLADFKNKLVFIYFGYTYCPDICPTNLANLANAYQQLSEAEQNQLQILFISVDPERDSLERLEMYAGYFHAGIIGITGDQAELSKIANNYGAIYQKVDDGTEYYAVDHSAFTYVVDQQGNLQEQLPHAASPQQFIDTVKKYLN